MSFDCVLSYPIDPRSDTGTVAEMLAYPATMACGKCKRLGKDFVVGDMGITARGGNLPEGCPGRASFS